MTLKTNISFHLSLFSNSNQHSSIETKQNFFSEILQALYLQPTLVLNRQKRDLEAENITFTFDCKDRAIGFYADVEYRCRIFHMCDEDGRRVPHMCANDTSFNQEYRICDWEYNFNCSEAPMWLVQKFKDILESRKKFSIFMNSKGNEVVK